MEKQIYITEEERAKCQKVADAFAELYERADILVVDAGRYGFVVLKYYMLPHGFEEDATFTDSRALFEELWQEWLDMKLYLMAKGTPLMERRTPLPCPHFDIKIVQRSNRQSAIASAAYQSGERLFSEYDQKQKYYSHKSEIVHTEIMLPPHAPPEYADRNTLWNSAEAQEKQWNSQLARRFVLAIPREIPPEQYAGLIRDYCREFFVSKGMIADFAIYDKGDGKA